MPRSTDSARVSANAVERLNEAITLLKQANIILEKLESGWSVPDAPEQPPVVKVLDLIKTQTTQAMIVTKRLRATLGKT